MSISSNRVIRSAVALHLLDLRNILGWERIFISMGVNYHWNKRSNHRLVRLILTVFSRNKDRSCRLITLLLFIVRIDRVGMLIRNNKFMHPLKKLSTGSRIILELFRIESKWCFRMNLRHSKRGVMRKGGIKLIRGSRDLWLRVEVQVVRSWGRGWERKGLWQNEKT